MAKDRNKDAAKALAEALRPALKTLVDQYAEARKAKTQAEKAEALLRKQLLDQFDARGTNRLEGKTYEVTRSTSTRDLLDGDKVRALLTPAQVEAVTKQSVVTNLSVVELAEVVTRSVA